MSDKLTPEQRALVEVFKINNGLLIKQIRLIIREELDYALAHHKSTAGNITESRKPLSQNKQRPNVAKGIKAPQISSFDDEEMGFDDELSSLEQTLNETVTNRVAFNAPNDMYEDENGRIVSMDRLQNNPNVHKAQEKMFANLASLID